MGSSPSCTLFAPPPFERDEIKKAQHRWRCVPLNVLTQGSSLRSPTLGYQKRNTYSVEKGISNDDLSFSL